MGPARDCRSAYRDIRLMCRRSPLRYSDCAVAEAGGDERNGAVRIGEAPAVADAVPGRLLPLRGQDSSLVHGVIVISGLTWAADPSAPRPSVTYEKVKHLPQAPCSSYASCVPTLALHRSQIAASAGFPDQANKFPDDLI